MCPRFCNRARLVNQAQSLSYMCNIKHFVEPKAKMRHFIKKKKKKKRWSHIFQYEEAEIMKSIPTRTLPPSTVSRRTSGLHSASVTTAQSYARGLTQKSLGQGETKSRHFVALCEQEPRKPVCIIGWIDLVENPYSHSLAMAKVDTDGVRRLN